MTSKRGIEFNLCSLRSNTLFTAYQNGSKLGWVLKRKIYGQESTFNIQKLTIRQILGMILENEVVQKMKFEKNLQSKNNLPN